MNRQIHGGDRYRNPVDIDFSVNLNPLSVPDKIRDALELGMRNADRYPDPEQEAVRKALAEADGLDPAYYLAGNGASELIMAVTAAIAPKKAAILCPCFSGYERALGRIKGCGISSICLKEEEGFVLTRDVAGRIPEGTELLCLTDPVSHSGRNPGEDVLSELLTFCAEKGIKVLLDESFYLLSERFSGGYDAGRIRDYMQKYPGLYILRSFTKAFGLPGIRMGYLISAPGNIESVHSQLPEWNLGMPAQFAMPECAHEMKDGSYLSEALRLIAKERRYLQESLRELGYTVFDSDTVYLCFKADAGLYRYLLDRRILIRDLTGERALGEGFYRIAVKLHADNEKIVRYLKEYRER